MAGVAMRATAAGDVVGALFARDICLVACIGPVGRAFHRELRTRPVRHGVRDELTARHAARNTVHDPVAGHGRCAPPPPPRRSDPVVPGPRHQLPAGVRPASRLPVRARQRHRRRDRRDQRIQCDVGAAAGPRRADRRCRGRPGRRCPRRGHQVGHVGHPRCSTCQDQRELPAHGVEHGPDRHPGHRRGARELVHERTDLTVPRLGAGAERSRCAAHLSRSCRSARLRRAARQGRGGRDRDVQLPPRAAAARSAQRADRRCAGDRRQRAAHRHGRDRARHERRGRPASRDGTVPCRRRRDHRPGGDCVVR